MKKIDDLAGRAGFDEELTTVASAVLAAVAGAKPSAENMQGSIDVEVATAALMMVAAGLIGADINLTTPRATRLQAEAFGTMLKDMAIADHAAGAAGEQQFLQILGGGVAPGKATKTTH